jgi:solute carrier family 35, member C2
MTSLHFLCQYIFSYIACFIAPNYFGSYRIQQMSWYEWFMISVPCGIVTSGDVGLSNLSLVRITITFYTMIKASTPIFVLFWAYLFGIERITPQLLLVVLIIAFGEYFTVKGEIDFDHVGFILCLCASMLSGARWTLVQLKLRSLDPPLKTTIATMRLLSPSMFISLLLFSVVIEKPWNALSHKSMEQTMTTIGLGLLGANLAIAMILCEFYLIMHANAIILMIGGVIKEMVSIFIGVMYFDDTLNHTNIFGCFIVFLGVVFYKIVHYVDSQQHEKTNDMIRISTSEIDLCDTNNNNGDIDDNNKIDTIDDSISSNNSNSKLNGDNNTLLPSSSPKSKLRSPFNNTGSNKYEKLLNTSDMDDSDRYDDDNNNNSNGKNNNISSPMDIETTSILNGDIVLNTSSHRSRDRNHIHLHHNNRRYDRIESRRHASKEGDTLISPNGNSKKHQSR